MKQFFSKIKLADDMVVGSDFEVYAVLKNNNAEERTCTFMFSADAISYSGKPGENCGFVFDTVKVPSGGG